jgi:hypothetical protein
VQVLLYLAAGVPLADIVALTGYRPRSIRQIAQRYIEMGADSLVDRRSFAQGAAPMLSSVCMHNHANQLAHSSTAQIPCATQ